MSDYSYSLAELAAHSGAELRGESGYAISSLANLQQAKSHQLSFLANPSYAKYLSGCSAGAIILNAEMALQFDGNCLIHADPYACYAKITALFSPQPQAEPRIHSTAAIDASAHIDPTAIIAANAVIEARASVGANAYIGPGSQVGRGSSIGAGTRLAANVSVYHGVSIGEECIIHAGTVIGSDGFGFAPSAEGWIKVHQLGGVRIGNKVEIGANTAIDRGALDDTVIGNGVKLDNLVHIAHNVVIGDNTAIAGHVGIAGSTTIGANCLMAGFVAVNGHISVADGVRLSGATVVTKSITEPNSSWSSGTGMLPSNEWRKQAVRFSQLDSMSRRIKALEKNT